LLRRSGDVFVGREETLQVLAERLDSALAGSGGTVLVTGEAGMGKTSLLRELARRAAAAEFAVRWGHCDDDEGAPALWPWAKIFNGLAKAHEPAPLSSSNGPGEAQHNLSTVTTLGSQPRSLAAVGPELLQERFRLFEVLLAELAEAARHGPILLLLEDLHWADPATLGLLTFLARDLDGLPVLLACTCREIGRPGAPLSAAVSALLRQPSFVRIPMEGLSVVDILSLLGDECGGMLTDAQRSLAVHLKEETGGNPFLLRELIQEMATQGRSAGVASDRRFTASADEVLRLPLSIRDVFSERLARLSDECRQALAAMAVLGREFTVAGLRKLEAMTGLSLLDALDEAEQAHLVEQRGGLGGHCRFVHGLARKAVYAGIPTAARVRLHLQAGESLLAIYGEAPEHLEEIANHFLQAAPHDSDQAVRFARLAAAEALQAGRFDAAVRWDEAALEVLDPEKRQERGNLLIALGEAYNNAGDVGAGKKALSRVATIAREIEDNKLLIRAALAYGGTERPLLMPDRERVALLEEALTGCGDTLAPERVRLLGRLVETQVFWAPADRQRAVANEALDRARDLGDKPLLMSALRARRLCDDGRRTGNGSRGEAEEMIRLAEDTGIRAGVLEARRWQVIDALARGDLAGAAVGVDNCGSLTAEMRLPAWRREAWEVASWRASLAAAAGRFADADRLSEEARAAGRHVHPVNAQQRYLAQITGLRFLDGRMPETIGLIPWSALPAPTRIFWRCHLALALSETGQRDAAEEELRALAADDFAGVARLWSVGDCCLARLSLVAHALGDRAKAQQLYNLLEPSAEWCLSPSEGSLWFGSVSHYLGLLAATGEQWDSASRHFEDALRQHEQAGARPWLVLTQLAYAEMLSARGGPAYAARTRDLAGAALTMGQALGMTQVPARAGRLLGHTPPQASLAKHNRFGLTRRELEVMRLLAAGHSSPEIAAKLVISVRTAEHHVYHIYNKTGAHRRAGAAALATRAGWTGQDEGL